MAVNILEVEVRSKGIQSTTDALTRLASAGQQAESSQQKVNKSFTESVADGDKTTSMLQRLGQQIYSLRQALGGVVLTGMFAGAAAEIVRMSDAWQLMNARLQIFVGGAHQAAAAQQLLFNMSQDLRVPLESTTQLYTRLVPAMQQYGRSAAEAEGVTRAVGMALKLSGATGAETASVMLQFSQAMQAGRLNGQEFNAVAEGAPLILRALEEQTGKTRGELKKMGADGKLGIDLIVDALNKQVPAWEEAFSKLPLTVDSAMTQMKNALTKFFGELNQSVGITNSLANSIGWLAKNLESVAVTLSGAIIGALSVYITKLGVSTAGSIAAALAERQRMMASLAAAKADEAGAVAALNKAKALGTMAGAGRIAAAQERLTAATIATTNAQKALTAQSASWLAMLGRFINPYTLIAAALGGLAYGLYQAKDATVEFGETSATVSEIVEASWMAAKDTVSEFAAQFGVDLSGVTITTTDFANAVKASFFAVGKVVGFVGDVVSYFFVLTGKLMANGAAFVVGVANTYKEAFSSIADAIANKSLPQVGKAISKLDSDLKGLVNLHSQQAKDAFSESWGVASRSIDNYSASVEKNIAQLQTQKALDAQTAAEIKKRAAQQEQLNKIEAEARIARTAGSEEAEKAAKKLAREAATVLDGLKDSLVIQKEELKVQANLTEEGKKVALAMKFLDENKRKLNATTYKAIELAAQQLKDLDAQQIAQKELNKAEEEYAKIQEKVIEREAKQISQRIEADQAMAKARQEWEEQIQNAQDELDLIPKTSQAIAERTKQRYEETVIAQQQRVAEEEYNVVFLTRMQRQNDAYTDSLNRAREVLAAEQAKLEQMKEGIKYQEQLVELAKDKDMLTMAKDFGSVLTNSLKQSFDNGKSFASNFWSNLKNMVKEKIMVQIQADITNVIMNALRGVQGGSGGTSSGAAGASGGGGLGGMLGGLLSMGDKITGWVADQMGGNGVLGSILNKVDDVFGGTLLKVGDTISGALKSVGGISGALTFVSALTAKNQGISSRQRNTSAAMNIGMAAAQGGPWAAAAMAIVEIGKWVAGKKGGPRTSGEAFLDTKGSTAETAGMWKSVIAGGMTDPNRAKFEKEATDIVSGVVGQYKELAKALGSTTDSLLKFGFGLETDPQGDAPSKIITSLIDAMGNKVAGANYETDRDPAKFQAQLELEASRLLVSALKASSLPDEIAKVFNSVDVANASKEQIATLLQQAQAVRAVSLVFDEFGKVLPKLSNLSYSVKENLIGFAGGLEALDKSLGTYYKEFYSEQEQQSLAVKALSEQFKALGLVMPVAGEGARTAFRNMVEGIDISTEAGQKQYTGLLALAGAFAELNPVIVDTTSAVETAVDNITVSIRELELAARDTKLDLLSQYDSAGAQALTQRIVSEFFGNINNEVGKLGLTVPTTAEAFVGLIHSINPATESGRKLAEELKAMSPYIDTLIKANQDAAAAEAKRVEEIRIAEAEKARIAEEARQREQAAIDAAGQKKLDLLAKYNPEYIADEGFRGLSAALSQFNAQIPQNRDEMNALLHSIDVTTEGGRKLADVLNNYAGYIDSVISKNAAIQAQKQTLEEQYQILLGNTTARQLEIDAMDSSVRVLALRNDALMAEKERLEKIENTRKGIQEKIFDAEMQLLEAQGKSSEAIARRRAIELEAVGAIDQSLVALQQYYYSKLDEIEAVKAAQEAERQRQAELEQAAQKAKAILDERTNLEQRLFDMTATVTQKREAELMKLDASNRAILERIFMLEDEIAAAERAKAVAQERYGLETQLLQLQGNTAELRRRELEALDPSNRALMEMIWALQAQQAATEAASRAADEYAERRRREIEESAKQQSDWAKNWFDFKDSIVDSISELNNVADPLGKRIREIAELQSKMGIEGPAQFSGGGISQLLAQKDYAKILRETSGKSETDFAKDRLVQMEQQLAALGVVAPKTTAELRNLVLSLESAPTAQWNIYREQGQKSLAILATMLTDMQAVEQAQQVVVQNQTSITDNSARLAEIERRKFELQLELAELQGRAGDAVAMRRAQQLRDELVLADDGIRNLTVQIHLQQDLNEAYRTSQEAARQAVELQRNFREYETKLMEAQGRSAEVLARKREDELLAADPLLRNIIRQIHAQEDLNLATEQARKIAEEAAEQARKIAEEAAEQARKIAEERSNLELRLLEAQGNSTAVLAIKRQQEIASLDASNRSILEQIFALEDLKSAQETAAQAEQARVERLKKIAEERSNLELRLLEVQGNSVEVLRLRREAELASVDVLNRAILLQIYATEDAAKAATELAQAQENAANIARQIAEERNTLEMRLLEAQGNTIEVTRRKREAELAATDASNRALLIQIYALEDLKAAQEAATSATAQQAEATKAHADRIKQAQDALKSAYDREAGVFKDAIDKFRGFGKALREFRNELTSGPAALLSPEAQYMANRSEFERIAALAMTGDANALGSLQDVSKAYLEASKEYYASSAAYFADLAAVKLAVQNAEISADAAADVQQLQLNAMTSQVSQLVQLNQNVVSVAQAIQMLNQANAEDDTEAEQQQAALMQLLQQQTNEAVQLRQQLANAQTISNELMQRLVVLTNDLNNNARLAASKPV